MGRALAASAVLFWVGATLVLSQLRWFRRRPLLVRLRPYEPGGMASGPAHDGLLSVTSFREVVEPVAQEVGARLAALLGVSEDVAHRLERIHSPIDASAFRLRQLGWAGAGLAGGSLLIAATRPPMAMALLFLIGGPLLGFLIVEQQLASASDRWKRRIFLELPVVSEQIGMLLGAG